MRATDGSTGRIERTITPSARRILCDQSTDKQIDEELRHICTVDFAHILMLAEAGIVKKKAAALLFQSIRSLLKQRFEPMKTRPSPRGIFLAYEGYLIETEGPSVGGILQTGRSRNDLSATIAKLRLREAYVELLRAALRLQVVLIRRGEIYSRVVMPAYTHGQAAEPITYGHYLAGVAEALRRDIDGLVDAAKEIDVLPLGAGAVAGTSLPINRHRTAQLLGFARVAPNSVDAVASRDSMFRILAAAAILGITLSRVAADLLQWLTAEFAFLSLPDELIGSSSAMPQKRNPYLLEHVQGRSASAAGAFIHALSATRSAPFTNSIAVGTEAVRPIWSALKDLADAITLLRLVIAAAQPNANRMLSRATGGFTNASAIAVRMTREIGIDFRSAHRRVGGAITEALSQGFTSLEALDATNSEIFGISLNGMDATSVVGRAKFGGGPASESVNDCLAGLREAWHRHMHILESQRRYWMEARTRLEETIEAFCDKNLKETDPRGNDVY